MIFETIIKEKDFIMDANEYKVLKAKIKRTLKNFELNNINAVFVENKEDALKLVKQLIPQNANTSSGGSITLQECGILDYLKENTAYLDFFNPGLTREEKCKMYLSDFFLLSANAITEHGEIYEVDGRSNRVSALLHGPDKVIIVAGINKLVYSLKDAVERVKQTAAPINSTRLCKDTFCAKNGICISPSFSTEHLMCEKRCGEDTICCNTVIMAHQREKERITLIIVGENLGY